MGILIVTAVAAKEIPFQSFYDITEFINPTVSAVVHLSPASETKSAGVVYNKGTVGETDIVRIRFLSAFESPSGKPALTNFGQATGTISLWEFECAEPDDARVDLTTDLGEQTSEADAVPYIAGWLFGAAWLAFLALWQLKKLLAHIAL